MDKWLRPRQLTEHQVSIGYRHGPPYRSVSIAPPCCSSWPFRVADGWRTTLGRRLTWQPGDPKLRRSPSVRPADVEVVTAFDRGNFEARWVLHQRADAAAGPLPDGGGPPSWRFQQPGRGERCRELTDADARPVTMREAPVRAPSGHCCSLFNNLGRPAWWWQSGVEHRQPGNTGGRCAVDFAVVDRQLTAFVSWLVLEGCAPRPSLPA